MSTPNGVFGPVLGWFSVLVILSRPKLQNRADM
jgi:hypothetical protein